MPEKETEQAASDDESVAVAPESEPISPIPLVSRQQPS